MSAFGPIIQRGVSIWSDAILYGRGRATAAEVMDDLPERPHYSTVRTQLRMLEDKGHV